VTFVLLLSLATAFLAGACKWLARKHVSEAERRELVNRCKEVIEAGGDLQVWVKAPASLAPARADSPIEVLATSDAYPAVVSALQREAEKDGLEWKSHEARGRDRRRTADIRLAWRGEGVCRWRLREVGHLLRAAIVIDDLGQDLQAARNLLALPYPLTFSVLPHLPHSVQTAEEAHRAGHEVMLHLPMEPEPGPHPSAGLGEIRTGMSREELRRVLQQDLDSVPRAAGVNNHMGSRATLSTALMAAVMQALAEQHLYFVDSRTASGSVALEAARRQGLPTFYRSVFLDDTETVPYTLGQLREFRRRVETQGVALAIGHPHPSTCAALARFLPELTRDDIQLVPASKLVQLSEVARLWPPGHVEHHSGTPE